jgi:hypothetical protein
LDTVFHATAATSPAWPDQLATGKPSGAAMSHSFTLPSPQPVNTCRSHNSFHAQSYMASPDVNAASCLKPVRASSATMYSRPLPATP